MSQEKIDFRKNSKGDLLHREKEKRYKMLATLAIILVLAGGLGSAIAYNVGYNKGEAQGEANASALYDLFNSYDETTTEVDDETTIDAEDETAADEENVTTGVEENETLEENE